MLGKGWAPMEIAPTPQPRSTWFGSWFSRSETTNEQELSPLATPSPFASVLPSPSSSSFKNFLPPGLVRTASELAQPPPEPWCDCGLSTKQRVIGFVFCFVLGSIFSMISTMYVPLIALSPSKFAIPYTIGNLLSIGSTGFLVGPWRQIKSMFEPKRIAASGIYLLSMVGTLVFALYFHWGLPTIACVIVQFCSFFWYASSYIPFGQEMFCSGCKYCSTQCCGL